MASQRVQDFAQIVEVKGLRELNAELKKANPEMAKKLQRVNKELVERVAARAKSNFYRTVPGRARSSDRPRRSGRGSISTSRNSIRASASGQQAKVIVGGAKAPAFFGHEFGGGARPSTRQFPVHRGRDGYVVYPEVRRSVKTAEKDWDEIFDEVFPG